MPGSLLLGNDAYSDVSDISGSLDSKIGGKKVSFNKAVRVKQYPWKPELEVSTSEHLTLPSNRFWFKVYKNKQDSPISYDCNAWSSKQIAWDDENVEGIHDSLAPIAEVEDQDIDSSPTHSNSLELERNINQYKVYNERSNDHNFNNTHYYHPIDPPVDYLDDMSSPSRSFSEVKHVWGSNELENNRFNYNNDRTNNSLNWNCNGLGYQPEIIMENVENLTDSFFPNPVGHNSRLSRSSFRNDNTTRRSVRNIETPNNLMLRERRSRSHDDHIDSDNRFKQLRKADKSVSTEDLNFDNKYIIPTNRFFKSSRDIATQCYGTLNRYKNPSKVINSNISSSSQTESYLNNTERLKNFKSTTSKLSYADEQNNSSVNSPKKDYVLDKFNRPRDISRISTTHSLNHDSVLNEKLSNGNLKPLTRTENSIHSILQRQANKTFNKSNSKSELSPTFIFTKDTRKNQENTCQNNENLNSNTVGYLRGRQIPLNEVNTNTNRRLLSRNSNEMSKSLVSRKTDENVSLSSNRIVKSNGQVSNGCQSKRYLSPPNNSERRSFRNSSAKSHTSSNSEGGSSMIDWSLSGFQLTRKPENGITSMSDSEYTVHRRPPLLMYIPGVSHHDRPAIEDDRLSALSDLSRSELNDGVTSLLGGKDKNAFGDFRRRQSMREGKSKWLKWKSKS